MSKYDVEPETQIQHYRIAVSGSDAIINSFTQVIEDLKTDAKIVVECYPGVDMTGLVENILALLPIAHLINSEKYAMDASQLRHIIDREMTDDRVFGMMTHYTLDEFYPEAVQATAEIDQLKGCTIVYGTGASLVVNHPDLIVYCDLARWEIQLRYRQGMANWHQNNPNDDPLHKFKRGYFFDWRVADRLKKDLLSKIDYFLDTNNRTIPKLVDGKSLIEGLKSLGSRPFRTVPYFDASVWGGQWMKHHYELSENGSNYGWAFDGVPEENSLFLRFGKVRIETPAMNLMLIAPKRILGEKVYARFGAEFPIRFDYLDTMEGQNLSLQVHPLTGYIQQHYGMNYTQDESYYILEAKPDASVYLGVKAGTTHKKIEESLRQAASGTIKFPDKDYINQLPAKKGDHFLIPAGTIHCGGAGTVILEISATPYIFTFKMWDWGRIGLDGKPRPLHIKEGMENIQLNRDTNWVCDNLVDQFSSVNTIDGHQSERTGLHPTLEFIETQRHTIVDSAYIQTHGSVNMLNLVEGEAIIIESLDDTFPPFAVTFGETFIIPESVKEYRVRNLYPQVVTKLLQAYVK